MYFERQQSSILGYAFEPTRLLYPGDQICFKMRRKRDKNGPKAVTFVRTNLFMRDIQSRETVTAFEKSQCEKRTIWHDYEMELDEKNSDEEIFTFECLLSEAGYFWAKPYIKVSDTGEEIWPEGDNLKIHVHRNKWKKNNVIYGAWARLMDSEKAQSQRIFEEEEIQWELIESQGNWVQPKSGTLRNLKEQIPFIMDELGCSIIQLMPVNPVPFTNTKLGRMGSPYAAKSLVDIDSSIVEFDRTSTGVEQFEELCHAIHVRGGKVILDLVINHTGWGSDLFENNPEFFERGWDGTFVSPGAWGTVWEDLVALNHQHFKQAEHIKDAFLTWCARGVDGFRCDAGYQVPLPIWRYITTSVLKEFPDTLFLLEGLGGALEATQDLLEEGGMQWAYSELFQNESNDQIYQYSKYSSAMSQHVGLYVHFSETHDNNRLAAKGKDWSLFRNKLCAALSSNGGFGFTTGVEWLADEKIRVHHKSGLNWGHSNNIVSELKKIIDVIQSHPAFAEDVVITPISSEPDYAMAWERRPFEEDKGAIVLVNNHPSEEQSIELASQFFADKNFHELFGEEKPQIDSSNSGSLILTLKPYSVHVLSKHKAVTSIENETSCDTNDLIFDCISQFLSPGQFIPKANVENIHYEFQKDPISFLDSLLELPGEQWNKDWYEKISQVQKTDSYKRVIVWNTVDANRQTLIPEQHWLLVEDTSPFRIEWPQIENRSLWIQSKKLNTNKHLAIISPQYLAKYSEENNFFNFYGAKNSSWNPTRASILYCPTGINERGPLNILSKNPLASQCTLLTNQRGGMSITRIDFGDIKSKYDCLLGANLNASLPVDRHIFVKRLRIWLKWNNKVYSTADISLLSFEPGPEPTWIYQLDDHFGKHLEVAISLIMVTGQNSVSFKARIFNPHHTDSVDIILRPDLEDRNFHTQTNLNPEVESSFISCIESIPENLGSGFIFKPAQDRTLKLYSTTGTFYAESENVYNIEHAIEASRGQPGAGDAISPGCFVATLSHDKNFELLCTSEENFQAPDGGIFNEGPTSVMSTLTYALKQFVVKRDGEWTVIAGYPWFLDWGRDTLIVARGMISAGLKDEVRGILKNFGKYEIQGTLPNTIHGTDLSNRHTSDAPLWYGVVCEDFAQEWGESIYKIQVEKGGRTVQDILISIAEGYQSGTPAGMYMDSDSGLIWSPSHYTWMDTNFPAGTPREGYPIEIQILWWRLIRLVYQLTNNTDWNSLASRVEQSINDHFWRPDLGYYADLLVGNSGTKAKDCEQDSALRSNQVLAVSLGFPVGQKAKWIVESVRKYLLLPGALRSLAPLPVEREHPVYSNDGSLLNDPKNPFWPRYEGDEDTRRKPAYHNGTGWTWTFPGFCEAMLRAYPNDENAINAARSYLNSSQELLWNGCLGQIPENVDGAYPHNQRGCQAQAWGVSELIRVYKFVDEYEKSFHKAD